jgi:hypothetical protein
MMDAFWGSAFRGFAMARIAETILRAVGATTIHIIREAQFTGTLQQRQLGQVQPQYNDIEIGPAMVRAESVPATSMRIDVTLPGRVVRKFAQVEGAANGTSWLLGARGILYQGTLLRITDVTAELFAGVEYLYRVKAEV